MNFQSSVAKIPTHKPIHIFSYLESAWLTAYLSQLSKKSYAYFSTHSNLLKKLSQYMKMSSSDT